MTAERVIADPSWPDCKRRLRPITGRWW